MIVLPSNLSAFVNAGGSIYASDYSYGFIEASFPNEIDFLGDDQFYGQPFAGDPQTVVGTVLDPGWQNLVGPTAQISYDLFDWVVIESSQAEILIEGSFAFFGPNGPGFMTAPLAVRFEQGQGTALYTTFHDEQQVTFDMAVLLEDMVLSL